MPGGAIAAGHPLTAEAGAQVLREGGNAVDAAVCAVLTSFAAESPLTGFGAGGFMLIHDRSENLLLDFFVEAPGRTHAGERGELVPLEVFFDETPQVFNIGAAACGTPGTAAGLAEALDRFGSLPMAELIGPAVALARDGLRVTAEQAYLFVVLEPIITSTPEARALYAPEGRLLREGDTFRFPDLAGALERYAAEGPELFYRGEVARAVAAWVCERGGAVGLDDLAAYEVIERRPAQAAFRGRRVLTNPPPSAGGILVALCLALLDRLGSRGTEALVEVMEEANLARSEEFHAGLYDELYLDGFLSGESVEAAAGRILARRAGSAAGGGGAGDRLGSTTHIAAIDSGGMCASVTCSNGTCSGVVVPGTGVHLNNMLGEEDLNPLGFHATPPGHRIASMMAPTVVLREGAVELALGSAGSNRLRSAILQTIAGVIDDGLPVAEAVQAGRVHFEEGAVQAEPGVDERALGALEARGCEVVRWRRTNLFFGGVQAVARDPATGALSGAGDHRRGGTAIVV